MLPGAAGRRLDAEQHDAIRGGLERCRVSWQLEEPYPVRHLERTWRAMRGQAGGETSVR
jgi:hypothetical protein